MRSPHTVTREPPLAATREKPTCSNEDPAQPKERNQSKALRMTDIKKTKFCAEHGETNQSPHALLVGRQDGAAAAEDRLVALRGNTAAATTQQLHFWVHTRENVHPHRHSLQGRSQQQHSQLPRDRSNPSAPQRMKESTKCDIYIQWNIIQP